MLLDESFQEGDRLLGGRLGARAARALRGRVIASGARSARRLTPGFAGTPGRLAPRLAGATRLVVGRARRQEHLALPEQEPGTGQLEAALRALGEWFGRPGQRLNRQGMA